MRVKSVVVCCTLQMLFGPYCGYGAAVGSGYFDTVENLSFQFSVVTWANNVWLADIKANNTVRVTLVDATTTDVTIPSSIVYHFSGQDNGVPVNEDVVGAVRIISSARECTSLETITIPNSITNILSSAFDGCRSLKSITLPYSVTGIASGTFRDCSSLASVTMLGVESIGSGAFSGCSSLTEVAIPASVTDIAIDAFKGCDGMQRFVVDPENSVYASYDGALYTKDLKTLICYPGGRTDVKLPPGAVETKEDAFTGCGKLWAEWYRMFQKTRYDLTNKMEDRAIATLIVDKDTALDGFVLKDGKAYDAVIYISNTSVGSIRLTLPNGYTYKCFKGASPLTIPGNSQNILSITRVSDTVFLVSREELENAR